MRRAPLAGGAGVDVAWIGNYSWPGFAVTPDGTRVLYAHWDRRESNIMAMISATAFAKALGGRKPSLTSLAGFVLCS